VGLEILARKALVSYEGGSQLLVDASDIVTVVNPKGSGGQRKKGPKPASKNRDEARSGDKTSDSPTD
jgi:hypothetical protein